MAAIAATVEERSGRKSREEQPRETRWHMEGNETASSDVLVFGGARLVGPVRAPKLLDSLVRTAVPRPNSQQIDWMLAE